MVLVRALGKQVRIGAGDRIRVESLGSIVLSLREGMVSALAPSILESVHELGLLPALHANVENIASAHDYVPVVCCR
jgi:hypothetical protein